MKGLGCRVRRAGKLMHKNQPVIVNELPAVLEGLCNRFGIWRLAGALLLAAWRRRRQTGGDDVADLPDRLRRDIGLGPQHRPRRPDPGDWVHRR